MTDLVRSSEMPLTTCYPSIPVRIQELGSKNGSMQSDICRHGRGSIELLIMGAGQDPSLTRKLNKAAKAKASANTLNRVADELLEKKQMEGKADRTFDKVEWLLSLARPDLGERPVAEIAASEVLRVLKKVEARGEHLETRSCGWNYRG